MILALVEIFIIGTAAIITIELFRNLYTKVKIKNCKEGNERIRNNSNESSQKDIEDAF